MAANTSIEWTATVHPDGSVTPGKTWNPVTGCTKVSPGCAHCYAEGIATRLWPTSYPWVFTGEGSQPGPHGSRTRPREFTDVQTHEDRLLAPLSWRKPSRVFVNSMSDLFHEDVPDAFIDSVFAVMALAERHTFQVLTKRPARMRDYLLTLTGSVERMDDLGADALGVAEAMESDALDVIAANVGEQWPLPNVWLGVSVENQPFADERIPLLLQTPAAVRFISAEPLLGPVDLHRIAIGVRQTNGYGNRWIEWDALSRWEHQAHNGGRPEAWHCRAHDSINNHAPLDWVIVGGESGASARPCDLAWVRAIVQQCTAASVPVFVKQLGAHPIGDLGDAIAVSRLKDRKGGDMAEWPADLQVREWPEARA